MLPIRTILRNATRGPRRFERKKNNMVMPVALLVLLFLIGQAFWLQQNKHKFRPFAIQRITCDHCQKIGLIPDPRQEQRLVMCPRCFGVGFNSVRRVHDLDMLCLACDGLGRLYDRDLAAFRTCRRCDGRGMNRGEARDESRFDTEP
ncbi:MAG TPA: hypothetical protein PKE55_05500 [Kiritimatiellia bacterium]|nr:hypothetical protein [Kiritimatiellia bacterium]